MKDFANKMIEVQESDTLSSCEIKGLLNKRDQFRKKTTKEFQHTILSVIK